MKSRRIINLVCTLWILSFASFCYGATLDDNDDNDDNTASNRYQLTLTTADGNKHQIEIIGWSHEIVSPRDAASGLPTGKRQHKPFTVTKLVDKASPLIFNILANNENITEWQLDCWRPSRGGKEFHYKSIILTTPGIVDVLNESPHERGTYHVERELVSFIYQKIQWVYHESGVIVEDEWEVSDI
ncbi:MAG: type VI secretion system tube protein TssD [Pseudomonadota bacterium]